MKKLFAIIAVLALSAGVAAAQKFGIVDVQRVSQNYWKAQSESKSLQEEQQHLQDLQQQIRSSIDQLTKEIDAAKQDAENTALSQDRRDAAKKEADDKQAQIQQYQTSFQVQVQRFQRRAQDAQSVAEAEVIVSIKKTAQANKVDVVFYAQVAPYANIDLTDMVIEDLNSTQPKEAVAAPAPSAAPAPAPAAK
jgi:Skp family chaperone for outer membrane proteins